MKRCPSCYSDDIKYLKKYERCCSLAKCGNCGLVFATYIPDESITHEIYDNYGRNDYLSNVTVLRYNELLDSFEKYRCNNKILDVGCGIGYFLDVAKQRGWEVYGTEFSDKAVKICSEKGITMYNGIFNSAPFKEGEFDVITSFEVLEHVSDPSDVMNYVKFLRKGGAFYLTTPNFNSIIRIIQKSDWDVLSKTEHPEHLNYYTKRSYRYLLRRFGLCPVYIHTQGISISRLKLRKSSKKHEKYISASSVDERIRVSIEKSKTKKLLKRIVNKTLSLFGIGDCLKSMAEKK